MKVLGIVAGPRNYGNTARLVEEVIQGAELAGHDTKIFYLGDMMIGPLEAGENGYIYPKDDFVKIMPYIESMGALVFGTPIYYDHVSSRAKIFFDRLYYYSKSHGAEYRKLFPDGVKFFCAVSFGWDNPNVYDEVIEWVNERMSHYWNMEICGSIKAHGTSNKLVKDNEMLLDRARDIGKNL